MDSQSSCVVVTGFGPFRQHLVNSSWEAVKELSKLGLGSDMEVELQILQLPVDYRELVVHVGMDPAAKAIFLEQCGKNCGYGDADIRGFHPECGVCLPDGPEVIASGVSMRAVSRRAVVEGVEVAFSRDAGMSAITPTTCLCIMEMGAQRSSMSLHYLLRFRLACWEKPCKLSSRKCWRRLRKPGLNAWFTGNSAFAIPDKGNQLGDCSFREN
ncbi:pyroglutamyl-peptidase 1-like protein isoform X3 [Balaenoptera acutorostrata]|uniref:Pyroglutamyl-peptidase 1-like protein isoform X3 n=1 Tax=Balaenoptera acutorostrata TaxID=9767 RepID=A0ABM3TAI9_BALAC|nr:pyroglutamyl-peptidase 1-like protein isoform X3 [Balaenoptera acutorostrata]